MNQTIIYIDTPDIKEGKLEQLKTSMSELKSYVEENMPRLISYSFFLNENQTEMTVVAIHPDSDSLEYHLNKGKEKFKKFKEFIDLLKIEVYGIISDVVLDKLNKKAEMLGNGITKVYDLYTGFFR